MITSKFLLRALSLMIVIGTIFSSCANKYVLYENERYYDKEGKEIFKSEFYKKLDLNENIDVFTEDGDRVEYILKKREEIKRINDKAFRADFSKSINKDVSDKDIFIAYYKPVEVDGSQYDCLIYNYHELCLLKDRLKNAHVLTILHPDYVFEHQNVVIQNEMIFIDHNRIMDKYFFHEKGVCDHYLTLTKGDLAHTYWGEGGSKILLDDADIDNKLSAKPLKEIFYTETGKELTKEYFDKTFDIQFILPITRIDGDKKITVLVNRERYGQLEYASFQQQLNQSLGEELDYSKPIAMLYIEPIIGEFIDLSDRYFNFLKLDKWKKKYPEIQQLIVLSKEIQVSQKFKEGKHWKHFVQDRHGLIENTISKLDVVTQSWISILPDGRYRNYLGEEIMGEHIKHAKKGWE